MKISTAPKPKKLQQYLPGVIIGWMIVLVFFPCHEHGVGRDLYRVVHYGLIPLFFGITIFGNISKVKERFWLQLGWVDWAMISYLVFVLVSVVLNDALPEGPIPHIISIYRRVFVAFAAYWIIRLVRPGEKEIRSLVPVMVFLCIAESATGLIAWFRPDVLPSIWPGRVNEFGGPRITGTFTQADVYSGSLVFFSTFVLQVALMSHKKYSRILYVALFDLAVVSIFFSYSRASWLAAIAVLITLACLHVRTFLFFIAPGLLLWGSLLTMVDNRGVTGSVMNDQGISHPIERNQGGSYALQRFGTSETLRSRIITNVAGLKMFSKKPIFGWGYGAYDLHDWNFMEPFGPFAPTTWEREEATSHNTFLTLLAETGAVGFLLYTAPLWWWLVVTIKVWRRIPRNRFAERFADWRFFVMLWANLLFILLISQSIDIRFFPFTLVQLWLVLGFIANMAETYAAPNDGVPAT